MSTAAPSKPQTTSTPGMYEVARPLGRCGKCNCVIEPATKYVAALAETASGFARMDWCVSCWPEQDRKDVVGFWQAVMPRAEQKKKIFVDDAVLCELFERLGTVTEAPKLSFRFVLGLILMRKRLVLYESTRMEAEREVWVVRMKGRDDTLDLLNPKLDETQIHQVSQQLSEILQQEL